MGNNSEGGGVVENHNTLSYGEQNRLKHASSLGSGLDEGKLSRSPSQDSMGSHDGKLSRSSSQNSVKSNDSGFDDGELSRSPSQVSLDSYDSESFGQSGMSEAISKPKPVLYAQEPEVEAGKEAMPESKPIVSRQHSVVEAGKEAISESKPIVSRKDSVVEAGKYDHMRNADAAISGALFDKEAKSKSTISIMIPSKIPTGIEAGEEKKTREEIKLERLDIMKAKLSKVQEVLIEKAKENGKGSTTEELIKASIEQHQSTSAEYLDTAEKLHGLWQESYDKSTYAREEHDAERAKQDANSSEPSNPELDFTRDLTYVEAAKVTAEELKTKQEKLKEELVKLGIVNTTEEKKAEPENTSEAARREFNTIQKDVGQAWSQYVKLDESLHPGGSFSGTIKHKKDELKEVTEEIKEITKQTPLAEQHRENSNDTRSLASNAIHQKLEVGTQDLEMKKQKLEVEISILDELHTIEKTAFIKEAGTERFIDLLKNYQENNQEISIDDKEFFEKKSATINAHIAAGIAGEAELSQVQNANENIIKKDNEWKAVSAIIKGTNKEAAAKKLIAVKLATTQENDIKTLVDVLDSSTETQLKTLADAMSILPESTAKQYAEEMSKCKTAESRSSLIAEVGKLKKEFDTKKLHDMKENMRKDVSSFPSSITEQYKSRIDGSTTKVGISDLATEIKTLSQKLSTMEKVISSFPNSVAAQYTEKMSECKTEKDVLDLSMENGSLLIKLNIMKEDIRSLPGSVAEYEQYAKRMSECKTEKEISDLAKEIDTLAEKLHTMKEDTRSLPKRMSECKTEKEISDLATEIDTLAEKLHTMKEDTRSLPGSVAEYEQYAKRMSECKTEKEISDLATEIDTLAEKLHTMKEDTRSFPNSVAEQYAKKMSECKTEKEISDLATEIDTLAKNYTL